MSDAEKRQAYDQYGHAGVDPQMGGGGFQGGSFSDIFGDVFGDIFGGGGGGRRQGPQRGSDLRYTLEVSLEDAVRGKTAEIKVPSLRCAKVFFVATLPQNFKELATGQQGHGHQNRYTRRIEHNIIAIGTW